VLKEKYSVFFDPERGTLVKKQIKRQSGGNSSPKIFNLKESLVYVASIALIATLMFLLMKHNDK
jgi:hypothetical protein